MHRIAIVDDDRDLCGYLEDYLRAEGLEVHCRHDAAAGLTAASEEDWDLVILDVGLPDRSGFELLAELRGISSVPILMLTGRAETVDRVVGLEMGADDYLAKPFEPRELLARVRAILRRGRMAEAAGGNSPERRTYQAGDLILCTGTRRVRLDGRDVSLTQTEFVMLQMLLEADGNLVHREDISRIALEREFTPFDRSIDVHMSNLRKKLGPGRHGGQRITTIRGSGYIYTDVDDADPESGLSSRQPSYRPQREIGDPHDSEEAPGEAPEAPED